MDKSMKKMQSEEINNENPPILKTWQNLYFVVAGTLFGLMLFFYFFMKYFS